MDENFTDASILIVDDQGANVALLEQMLLRNGYAHIRSTTDPRQVQEFLAEEMPDLVLLDLMMPYLDGYEVMDQIRGLVRRDEFLPILILTADLTDEAKKRALARGATDFLSKPLDYTEVMLRIHNLLHTRQLHLAQSATNAILDRQVRKRTQQLEEARDQVITSLARAAELRDDETGRHTQRVGVTSWLIAQKLGMSEERAESIGRTAPLHDVGKLGIPDAILIKPGRITTTEFDEVKKHPQVGADLLKDGSHPLMETARTIAMTHHERFDGHGYPNELAGEDIPIEGRIVAVADAYDALTHRRPYKEAWPEERALAEIRDNSGTQFDPQVVEAFLGIHPGLGAQR